MYFKNSCEIINGLRTPSLRRNFFPSNVVFILLLLRQRRYLFLPTPLASRNRCRKDLNPTEPIICFCVRIMLSLSDLKRFFLPWKFLRNHTSDNADSGDEDHHDSNSSPSSVSSPSHHRSMTSGPIASLTGPRPSSAPVLTSISLSHPNQRLPIPDSSFHSPPSIASKSPVFSFSSNNLYHLNSPLTTSTCSSRARSSPSLSLSYTFSHPSFSHLFTSPFLLVLHPRVQ